MCNLRRDCPPFYVFHPHSAIYVPEGVNRGRKALMNVRTFTAAIRYSDLQKRRQDKLLDISIVMQYLPNSRIRRIKYVPNIKLHTCSFIFGTRDELSLPVNR